MGCTRSRHSVVSGTTGTAGDIVDAVRLSNFEILTSEGPNMRTPASENIAGRAKASKTALQSSTGTDRMTVPHNHPECNGWLRNTGETRLCTPSRAKNCMGMTAQDWAETSSSCKLIEHATGDM
ncbi:unnamed protein product [Mycena citricolor]|uniref:Uncharacterized protein n=1 Tax=Mycena citricolor TaxID=2018698 RepID=A0AAD2K3B2_9AGAR|nr:unnamed protein product [Mycena citricolor]